MIACKAGAFEQANEYFEIALSRQPSSRRILKKLLVAYLSIKDAVKQWVKRGSGCRYLLIKSWGSGFWSDISQVLGCLLLAEITGRIPIVHWGYNSRYGDGSGEDAFQYYFKPPSKVTLADICQLRGATFFPPKWCRDNLRAENVKKKERKRFTSRRRAISEQARNDRRCGFLYRRRSRSALDTPISFDAW